MSNSACRIVVESQILTFVVSPIFPKSVIRRRLANLPVIDMESNSNRNVGRLDQSGELGSVPAPRETDPTPVLTRPGVGPASTMVTRSCAREGRGVKHCSGNRMQTRNENPTGSRYTGRNIDNS